MQHVSGDVLGLRPRGCGKMRDLPNAAERIKVREKVISGKPYIVIGSCVDCWQTGSRMDIRCAIEDKVLLNFVMEDVRNPGPKTPLSA